MVSLLAETQPLAVRAGTPARFEARACANDGIYHFLLAA
jgi:hypothetical protein